MPIDYGYPAGGGYNLTTQGPGINLPGGTGPAAPNMDALLRYALQQRQEQEAWKRRQAEQAAQLDAFNSISAAAARAPQHDPLADLKREQMELALQKERDMQAAAMSPPVKYHPGGFNMAGGYMQADPHTMNAYQRQMYLPSGAGVGDSPADASLKEAASKMVVGRSGGGGSTPSGDQVHADYWRRQEEQRQAYEARTREDEDRERARVGIPRLDSGRR